MSMKNSSGKWLTKALFFELTPGHRPHACFTLKDEDHVDKKSGKVYKSLKKLFLASDDPTEYEFARDHLGGWGHWKEVQQVEALANEIAEWREERDVRMRSVGVRQIIQLAQEDGSYQASRYLADRGWEEKTAGRPTKQQVKQEARQQAAVKGKVSHDLDRLRKLGVAK